MSPAAAAGGERAPLPLGFGIAWDPSTEFIGANTILGGSPARLLRLSDAGIRALDELRRGKVRSRPGARLARRLTDSGLAHPRPPAATAVPAVTVVIPVRDRPRELERCLSALGGKHPVIVVDDGSVEPGVVAEVCKRHGAGVLRRRSSGGAGAARNDGVVRAMTPLIAFVDSDCVADGDWIAPLAAHFADPAVAAVAPRVRPLTARGALAHYLEARSPLDMGRQEAHVAPLTRLSYVPTAALLVRRDAVASTGAGFDPSMRYGEDVDMVWRLTEAGWVVRYDPAVEVGHIEPGRWAAVLARRFRYGKSAAPLARRHPGRVPALVLQPWPAAAVAAGVARRPLLGLAAACVAIAGLVRILGPLEVPPPSLVRRAAASIWQTELSVGRWCVQHALPVVAAVAARPGGVSKRTRLGRRLAAVSLLAGPPLAEWLRTRPVLDPIRFALAYVADEAAYGAGVYRGALGERLLTPLLPKVSWTPPSPPAGRRPGEVQPPPVAR